MVVAETPSEIVETHLAAAGEDDGGRLEIAHGAGGGQRPDRLLAPADLAAPARHVSRGEAQLAVDLRSGDAERQETVGLEHNSHFAGDAAHALDAADALHPLERAGDLVLHQPGQLGGGHGRRLHPVDQDRQARDLHAADYRLVDGTGQVDADLGDRVLHVINGAVGVHLKAKLDRGHGRALGDGRGDVLHPAHAGNRILNPLRDLGLQLGGRRPRLRDRHGNDGNIDVGHPRDRQPPEADKAEHDQDEEQDQRADRLADRPGGDVEAHRGNPF